MGQIQVFLLDGLHFRGGLHLEDGAFFKAGATDCIDAMPLRVRGALALRIPACTSIVRLLAIPALRAVGGGEGEAEEAGEEAGVVGEVDEEAAVRARIFVV